MINTWQFNLIGYFIFVVIFYQFYKIAVRHAKRDGAATILLQAIGGISILALVPFLPIVWPTNPKIYLYLIAACIFYAICDRLNTTGRKNLQVSVFSIISQLSTVFLIAYGFTFFREPVVFTKIIGATLILLGNSILIYKGGKFEFNKYVLISVLATLAFATAISIDIGISRQFNLPIYIFLTLLIPALMIMVAEKIPVSSVLEELKSRSLKYYLLTGLAWGITILFSLRSFQFGKVSLIVPLQATSVLLNVLVAYVFLKERDHEFKKIIAAILVIIGVYFTVLT